MIIKIEKGITVAIPETTQELELIMGIVRRPVQITTSHKTCQETGCGKIVRTSRGMIFHRVRMHGLKKVPVTYRLKCDIGDCVRTFRNRLGLGQHKWKSHNIHKADYFPPTVIGGAGIEEIRNDQQTTNGKSEWQGLCYGER